MPQRLRETYTWKMKFRIKQTGHTARLVLNGTNLGDFATGLPPPLVRPAAERHVPDRA